MEPKTTTCVTPAVSLSHNQLLPPTPGPRQPATRRPKASDTEAGDRNQRLGGYAADHLGAGAEGAQGGGLSAGAPGEPRGGPHLRHQEGGRGAWVGRGRLPAGGGRNGGAGGGGVLEVSGRKLAMVVGEGGVNRGVWILSTCCWF